MVSATLREAQADLAALIARLKPGEQMLIVEGDRPIARLIAEPPLDRPPRKPGSARGKLEIIAEDESHLSDFREYMP